MGESAGLFINVLTFYFCFRQKEGKKGRKTDGGIPPLSFPLPAWQSTPNQNNCKYQ